MQNFKSIKSAEVTFKPLTVLVGPNSAGKSSLLQSILLFAQNAQRNGRVIDTQARGQIILNGDLVSLGSIKESLNSNSNPDTDCLEFGGTFSLGNEFFRSTVLRQGRPQANRLMWDIKLAAIDNDDYSGLANVLESKVKVTQEGDLVEEIYADRTNGEHIVAENLIQNPRFSYEHKAVVSSSDVNEIKTGSQGDTYSAVSFASGLPLEGLIQKPRIEILLKLVFSEWDDFFRGYGTFNAVLTQRNSSRGNREELFAIYPSIDDALTQAVNSFDALLLRPAQSDESEAPTPTSRNASKRILARQIVDMSAVPWKTISDQMTSRGMSEAQLAEFFEAQEDLDEDLEEAIESEIRSFRERFKNLVQERFAEVPEAKAMEFDERIQGMQRGRISGSSVFEAVDNWNSYLTEKIRYLEPLREVPKAFYTYATGGGINPQIPLGSRGEHLAQALYDKTPRVYPLPGNLENKRLIPLIDAVNLWLPKLDLEGQIEVVPQGRQGFYLTVGDHVLPMLGTGISQVLPVLTLCLTARRGDLILLEQPELHLNPSIQQKLAEFLLQMSQVDRQILVETHSEYFVTRLRLLQARNEDMGKYIKLLFVEKSKNLGTQYREVETNSYGEIQEWPKGFFDQASNDLRDLMKTIAAKKIAKGEEKS
jgi:energy-coupling factor transporter ATP-binding protein EcfA2